MHQYHLNITCAVWSLSLFRSAIREHRLSAFSVCVRRERLRNLTHSLSLSLAQKCTFGWSRYPNEWMGPTRARAHNRETFVSCRSMLSNVNGESGRMPIQFGNLHADCANFRSFVCYTRDMNLWTYARCPLHWHRSIWHLLKGKKNNFGFVQPIMSGNYD